MQDATGIDSFQFNNLAQNAVPFIFVSEELPLEEIFSGRTLEKLKSAHIVAADAIAGGDLLKKVAAAASGQDHPLICLCRDGKISRKWAQMMINSGYFNCFYIIGGFAELKKK